MGKSSVYYYFKSKEEIFKAVVLYEANLLRNELTMAIKSVDSPVDKMRNYVFVRMKSFEKLSITIMRFLTGTSITLISLRT
jgi:AcrR family transcriptional regulator